MPNTTQTVKGLGGVDTRDFAKFAKALRKAAPELNVRLRTKLKGAAEFVAEDARKRAAPNSTKIPPSVKTRVTGVTTTVVAGGKKAPNAVPFEHYGKQGRFRHPVFGNRDVWVTQQAHPFFRDAVRAGLPAAKVAAVEALDEAITQIVVETDG